MTQRTVEVAGPPPGAARRLHPLTPLFRGWKIFAVVLAIAAQRTYQSDGIELGGLGVAAVLAAGALVGVAAGYASWRFTRYWVDESGLHLETGVLYRRSRRVRLDRLQAVDVVRPLAARALGLAELRLEVAGGGETEAPLAYLGEESAQRLRAELLARAAGLAADAPEAPERVLVHVPPSALLWSTLLSAPLIVTVAWALVLVAVSVATGQLASLGLLVPAVLAVWASGVRSFVTHYDFRVADSPDGLRLRHGLLETRAQTVPPGRVQAVRVVEPLLWRANGWVRLEVNVAGYVGERGQVTGVLLPVAPRPVAMGLLRQVLPGVDVDAVPIHPVPRRARWRRPVTWRGLGCGVVDDVFVARRGVLRRELDLIPHAKTQSLRLTAGPWERLLGLGSVHLDSTPGAVHVTAAHRDLSEARAIVDDETTRSRLARSAAAPERWMAGS